MLTKYRKEAKECVTYGKTKETCDKRGNHTTQVFELKKRRFITLVYNILKQPLFCFLSWFSFVILFRSMKSYLKAILVIM